MLRPGGKLVRLGDSNSTAIILKYLAMNLRFRHRNVDEFLADFLTIFLFQNGKTAPFVPPKNGLSKKPAPFVLPAGFVLAFLPTHVGTYVAERPSVGIPTRSEYHPSHTRRCAQTTY